MTTSKVPRNRPTTGESALAIRVGRTARYVRERLKLSQKEAAAKLGISNVHLCNVENNQSAPSMALVEKYRELWGVDLFVLAWCLHGDVEKLPSGIRQAAKRLADEWTRQLGAL